MSRRQPEEISVGLTHNVTQFMCCSSDIADIVFGTCSGVLALKVQQSRRVGSGIANFIDKAASAILGGDEHRAIHRLGAIGQLFELDERGMPESPFHGICVYLLVAFKSCRRGIAVENILHTVKKWLFLEFRRSLPRARD